jgi:two-component system CheB/CheR fusion protein
MNEAVEWSLAPLASTRSRLEQLAIANRRKDEFLAILGHELRSPLASIRSAALILGSQGATPPVRERTQALLERQVRRMTQLIDDLLDASRIAQGRLHLERERIDLRVVVSNAVETLMLDIQERHHRLATALPDAAVWVQGDLSRLEQVFLNLLANASKYTDNGGELRVSMRAQQGEAIVCVRDSGIGMAPEVLPHIFDLFNQVDQDDSRSKSGLGIGLTVARNLVQLHGGTITAASAGLGLGSEFTVCLRAEC